MVHGSQDPISHRNTVNVIFKDIWPSKDKAKSVMWREVGWVGNECCVNSLLQFKAKVFLESTSFPV